jgi:hypothetical protein
MRKVPPDILCFSFSTLFSPFRPIAGSVTPNQRAVSRRRSRFAACGLYYGGLPDIPRPFHLGHIFFLLSHVGQPHRGWVRHVPGPTGAPDKRSLINNLSKGYKPSTLFEFFFFFFGRRRRGRRRERRASRAGSDIDDSVGTSALTVPTALTAVANGADGFSAFCSTSRPKSSVNLAHI